MKRLLVISAIVFSNIAAAGTTETIIGIGAIAGAIQIFRDANTPKQNYSEYATEIKVDPICKRELIYDVKGQPFGVQIVCTQFERQLNAQEIDRVKRGYSVLPQ